MIFPDALARNFRALSHPHRATVFTLLSQHPEAGDSLEILHRATGIPVEALRHHITEMERAGVLTRDVDAVTGRDAYRLKCAELKRALMAALSLSETLDGRRAEVRHHDRGAEPSGWREDAAAH